MQDWFAPDHPYQRAIDRLREGYGPDAYPGSPMIAALTLRASDRMHLAELHPQEFAALEDAMNGFPVRVAHADGLAMAHALTPPDPRRGILVIDPSWEVKADYEAIPAFVRAMHRKWNVGTIMLWYPLLARPAHPAMLESLEAEGYPNALRHEVAFPPARAGHGMVGSGLFILNTPWGLEVEAARLSALFAALG